MTICKAGIIIKKSVPFGTVWGDRLDNIREETLKNLFLFKGITENIDYSAIGEITAFKKGEVIYSQNNYKRALAVLINGNAEAEEQSEGGTLCMFCAGSVFAAAAVFCSEKNFVSKITAKTDCEILFISEEELTKIFTAYPQTAVNYIAFLNQKIRFLNQKISVYSSSSTEAKVLKYFSANSGQKCNFSAIAETLKIGRTSLYRALDALEQKNLIVRNDGKVCVL